MHIPQNPNELEYRIMNSKEQQIKRYDFFISHSSMDSRYVQELILFENKKSKNVFCDWINDADYFKKKISVQCHTESNRSEVGTIRCDYFCRFT